jgi:S-(hydroxymethyl)glutathione dehydrogenase/alcohol dehydrogenase
LSIRRRAAVVGAGGLAPEIVDVEMSDLDADEVLVRIAMAGVCHTDLTWARGMMGGFPVVLGHECAGTVEAVGSGVQHLGTGDRVVVASTSHCGHCAACERGQPVFCERRWDGRARYSIDGKPVIQAFNIGAYAEATIVRDRALVKLPEYVPFEVGAVAGCAAVTGIGAVLNVARVEEGASVAVFGCGGIGGCVVLGAVAAGADRIVAIDPNPERQRKALELGATDVAGPDAEALKSLVPGGFDYAFEAVGRVDAMQMAVQVIRPAGTAVLIGVVEPGNSLVLDPNDVAVNQKHIVGCQMGDFRPAIDFDRYFRLFRRGKLNLDALVSAIIPLSEAATAFGMAERGEGLRTLLSMS